MEQKSIPNSEYSHIENVYQRDNITNKLTTEYKSPEFKVLENIKWIATEKIDGTNIRIMWDGKELSYNGKTDNAQIHGDLAKRIKDIFEGKEEIFIEKFGDKPVVIYCEGFGAGIQKGGAYIPNKDIIVFDVNINGSWLDRGNVEGIANLFGLRVVPIVKIGTLPEIIELVKNKYNSTFGEFIAEGVVARPEMELKGKFGRIICKIKERDF